MTAPKQILKPWTEFDRHTFTGEMPQEFLIVQHWMLKIMRKQNEIIRELQKVDEKIRIAVRKYPGRGPY